MKPSPNWWRHSPWLRRGSAGLAGALGGVEDLVDDAIGATPDAMGACSGWSTPVSAFKYFPSACRGRCSLRSWGSFGFIPEEPLMQARGVKDAPGRGSLSHLFREV